MELKVIDFMNSHKNWREELEKIPYCITSVDDGKYTLLKYSMIGSDFNEPIVRECRGLIVKRTKVEDYEVYDAVCIPFFKFGNYGESYVPDIDWSSAEVEDKIDGSLMKVWYDEEWHISTNNTIDAEKAVVGNFNKSFKELFEKALTGKLEDFLFCLDKSFTYMFELVGPYNKLVVPYEQTQLYFIGLRNAEGYEVDPKDFYSIFHFDSFNILLPERHKLHTLADCIDFANGRDWHHEGFVAVDRYWNRVKIKGKDYLAAAKVRNNGVITDARLLSLIFTDSLDDFLGYYPEYKVLADKLEKSLLDVLFELAKYYSLITVGQENEDKKTYALKVLKCPKWTHGFLFARWEDESLTALDFVKKQDVKKVLAWMKEVEND